MQQRDLLGAIRRSRERMAVQSGKWNRRKRHEVDTSANFALVGLIVVIDEPHQCLPYQKNSPVQVLFIGNELSSRATLTLKHKHGRTVEHRANTDDLQRSGPRSINNHLATLSTMSADMIDQ
jgi:hypothetical protein